MWNQGQCVYTTSTSTTDETFTVYHAVQICTMTINNTDQIHVGRRQCHVMMLET